MRKDIPLLLAGAMILYGCSNIKAAAKAMDISTPEPEKELYDPKLGITPTITPDLSYLFATPHPSLMSENKQVEPFLYFSQKTYNGKFRNNEDGSLLSEKGCGMFVGAMITGMDPDTYIQKFFNYFRSIGRYGTALSNKNGTAMEDHIKVLESLGFDIEDLTPNSTPQEIKQKIKDRTAKGIPVWIDAKLYGMGYGHHTMAIGVTDNGTITFNDPEYGEGIQIEDKDIKMTDETGKVSWKVFAIIPSNE